MTMMPKTLCAKSSTPRTVPSKASSKSTRMLHPCSICQCGHRYLGVARKTGARRRLMGWCLCWRRRHSRRGREWWTKTRWVPSPSRKSLLGSFETVRVRVVAGRDLWISCEKSSVVEKAGWISFGDSNDEQCGGLRADRRSTLDDGQK